MLHLFLDYDRLNDFQAICMIIADCVITPMLIIFGFAWAVRPQSSSEGL